MASLNSIFGNKFNMEREQEPEAEAKAQAEKNFNVDLFGIIKITLRRHPECESELIKVSRWQLHFE